MTKSIPISHGFLPKSLSINARMLHAHAGPWQTPKASRYRERRHSKRDEKRGEGPAAPLSPANEERTERRSVCGVSETVTIEAPGAAAAAAAAAPAADAAAPGVCGVLVDL